MKPFRRRTTRSEVSAMLRADATTSPPRTDLVQRLAALAVQAPSAAPGRRSLAIRRGVGAALAAGATVVAGIGASYAVGVVDAPWSPPAEAPRPTPTQPAPQQTTPPGTSEPSSPTRTPAGPADLPTSLRPGDRTPPASERNHGARGEEKGGPHRPTTTPPRGKANGPGNDRGRGKDRGPRDNNGRGKGRAGDRARDRARDSNQQPRPTAVPPADRGQGDANGGRQRSTDRRAVVTPGAPGDITH